MPGHNWYKNKVRSKAIREAPKHWRARCTLRFDGCTPHDNLVWCHSNRQIHGKGGNTKAHDIFGAIGCYNCHGIYDGRIKSKNYNRDQSEAVFDIAMIESIVFLFENGILVASHGGY